MRDSRSAWLALGFIVFCHGCEGTSRRSGEGSGGARLAGQVVATVNGEPIALAEVRALVEATGLSPQEALRRLQDAALLAQHAAAQGYGGRQAVRREHKRALVRALLAVVVEQRHTPQGVLASEVQARYEAVRGSLGLRAEDVAEHERDIRVQLATEQRKLALDKLLLELRHATRVELDEGKLLERLRDPALWGGRS